MVKKPSAVKKKPVGKSAKGHSGKAGPSACPKLPPLPTFQRVGGTAAPKAAPQAVKKKKKGTSKEQGAGSWETKKGSSVERRASSQLEYAPHSTGERASAAQQPDLAAQVAELQAQIAALRAQLSSAASSPASSPVESSVYSTGPSYAPPVTAAEQPPLSPNSELLSPAAPPLPDLAAQVAELQEQIAALRAGMERGAGTREAKQESSVESLTSRAKKASPAPASPQPPFTSYPPLANAAEQPPPPSTLDSRPSTLAAAKPLPIYELKETRPVGFQSQDILDSSSEDSRDGFFTGLLDRARMQWLMGDWEGLGSIDPTAISRSPDRGKLILLAGCGVLQSGNTQKFKSLLPAAKAANVLPDLRKALLASTFSVLAKAAQINGSNAKALRFERHAVAEMDKIGFLQGLRPPGRPQYALADVSRKTLESLETLERKNKFAEMEIEGLRSQVETLKARAISQPAPSSSPPASAAPAPAAQPPPKPPAEKKYYGLDGLDRKLEVFLDFDNGYFVELGANDGVNQSNTFYFEQSRGWKGVLIEPVLHNFIKCKAARSPENFFQCAACVGFDYKEETLRLHYSNLMTTPTGIATDCPDPEAQARGGYQYIPAHERDIVIHAPARTLQSILLEAQAPRVIDLLSLDVEGGEMEVLKGIDHSRFQFRFLLVECRRIDQLQEFLAPKGYSLVEKLSFHDYLFQFKTA